MSGRAQREIAIENRIKEELVEWPDYLAGFYYSIAADTATTKEKYIKYVKNFLTFCAAYLKVERIEEEDLKNITRRMVGVYNDSLTNKKRNGVVIGKNRPATVLAKICALSTFFEYLILEGLVDKNLFRSCTRPKNRDKDEIIYLNKEEVSLAFQNIAGGVGSPLAKHRQEKWKNRDRLLFYLPTVTGIRISALVDINVEDIDLINGTISVIEKENKARKLLIPTGLTQKIEEWLHDREEIIKENGGENEALFITIFGGCCKRITQRSVNKIIKKYSEGIDKDISVHKLRATFATNTYNAVGDIYVVADLLGHNKVETTKKYAQANERKKKEASNMMGDFVGL